jgi:Na+/H+ antiporter NhaD/arsenite permease-like protein
VSPTETFSLLFVLILIILVTGRYHRSVAALLGAFLTILFAVEYGLLSSTDLVGELVRLVDINTVLLVVGVMILAEAVAQSGFFEFIGLTMAKAVGGIFSRVSIAFVVLAIVFSSVISNITAMIIMGTLTVSLARELGTDPTQTILNEAVATNIGGLALMISSIPNLIVAAQLKVSFADFLSVSLPLTVILSLVSIPILARHTKGEADKEQHTHVVIDPWSAIENRRLFYRAAAVFVAVIVLFVFADSLGIPLGLIAMGGATAMLVLGGQDPESIFSGIDWGTVFFLTSFYIVVGGLELSGVIASMATGIVGISSLNHAITPVLGVWSSGIPSAVVDNIPMTLTLIPTMQHVSQITGFSIAVLGWAIVFGANLGGNLTPIGSAANILALGILKKQGKSIGWSSWFRRFGPLTILQLTIATVYVVLLSMIL